MSNSETLEQVVTAEDAGKRLDVVVARWLKSRGLDFSRSQVQTKIKDGQVTLNGALTKPKAEVQVDDLVVCDLVQSNSSPELLPEPMDLEVLHEDDDIIVINKATGLVVHPGSGNQTGTLVNGLLHHCGGQLSELADEGRPGIVHRLDKETSGCLVAAKSDLAYQSLVAQFSGRETGKQYIAIASGVPVDAQGLIENQIGRHPVNRQKMTVVEPAKGKTAITEYQMSHCDEAHRQWSWINCKIHTGRTHQIRVHLKDSLHCPILGDSIYAQPSRQKVRVTRLMLHAWQLELRHPKTGEGMRFTAELPEAFSPFLQQV